jgi:hypothetical protein
MLPKAIDFITKVCYPTEVGSLVTLKSAIQKKAKNET